jgi:hypothetical protein
MHAATTKPSKTTTKKQTRYVTLGEDSAETETLTMITTNYMSRIAHRNMTHVSASTKQCLAALWSPVAKTWNVVIQSSLAKLTTDARHLLE